MATILAAGWVLVFSPTRADTGPVEWQQREVLSPMKQPHNLQVVLAAITDARAEVADARRGRGSPKAPAVREAQQRLMVALESYSATLGERGQPLSYRLRDELAMYQAMFRVRSRH